MRSVIFRRGRTWEDIVVDGIVCVFLVCLCLLTIVPFLQVLTISVSPSEIASKDGLHIVPVKLDWSGYQKVFSNGLIWTGYLNTVMRVASGTLITIALLLMAGYALSKEYLPNRRFWTFFFVFTMYFSGGLIPTYFVVSGLGLRDTVLALILPSAVNVFALIVMRNFMAGIPGSLVESARMDGAGEFRILASIITPLSMPIVATIGIWSILYHWNEWFSCLLYINKETGFVLQLILRRILLEGQAMNNMVGEQAVSITNTDAMKMATLVVSIIPVIFMYLFLQKYFIKGTTLGAVKG